MIDLSEINLNLLLALDALLSECHVTRAAEKLDVTQAAMSTSLKQLRLIYDDALLVRGQKSRMRLTPFAKTLQNPVKHAITNLQQLFCGEDTFDPSMTDRIFHIGMSDYLALMVLPKLMQYLQQHAPNIQIIQHAVNYLDSHERFERDHLDLILGHFPHAPGSLKSQLLFSDDPVIVTDKNHPLLQKKRITVNEMMKYPQVFVALEGQANKSFIYDYFRDHGYDVTARLFTPHTLISLQSLPNTQLIAHSVRRLAQPFLSPLSLAMNNAPYQLSNRPKYYAKQYWHAEVQDDPGHTWLRQCIKSICQS